MTRSRRTTIAGAVAGLTGLVLLLADVLGWQLDGEFRIAVQGAFTAAIVGGLLAARDDRVTSEGTDSRIRRRDAGLHDTEPR